MSQPSTMPPSPTQPKLLDRIRAAIRTKHYSRRTEEAYVRWVVGFYTHILNKGTVNVRSPADVLGRKSYMRPGNPFAALPPAIADRFASIVATRYGDDFEAAITAFINLHGKK